MNLNPNKPQTVVELPPIWRVPPQSKTQASQLRSQLGMKTNMTKLISPYFLCTLCINHQPTSPATKTIKAHVCSVTNPKKFKMAPTTLPTIAGNPSAVFPASLLSASASLSNHFFKVPLFVDGVPPAPPVPPKKTFDGENNCFNSY